MKEVTCSSSIGTLTSLDNINDRIPLDNSQVENRKLEAPPKIWRPNLSSRSPIPPGRVPCCFDYLRYLARSSSAVLVCACYYPFFTAPPVFCLGAVAPAAWEGRCWCLNARCLR
eukprot:1157551-Pelagomonas_calceolata.AAC.2